MFSWNLREFPRIVENSVEAFDNSHEYMVGFFNMLLISFRTECAVLLITLCKMWITVNALQ